MSEFINFFRDMVGIKRSTGLKPEAEKVFKSNDAEGEVEDKNKIKPTNNPPAEEITAGMKPVESMAKAEV